MVCAMFQPIKRQLSELAVLSSNSWASLDVARSKVLVQTHFRLKVVTIFKNGKEYYA